MGVKLILAEKPSMGRIIASAIGPMTKYDGYLEGSGYVVSWAFGHLYELDDLEQYKDPSFKKGDKAAWKLSDLPFYPDGWRFRYSPCPDSGVKKQIRILKNLMNRKDIDTIYNAGDADREGEVIIRLVIDQNLKTRKNVLRLWLPALTPEAIRDGIKNARPDAEYDGLYQAGRTRAAIDWLMGIELTRFATIKSGGFVRVGRCVSPIVEKIVQREKEILDFKPKKYLGIASKQTVNGLPLELTSAKTYEMSEIEAAQAYADKLNAGDALVVSIDRKHTIVRRPKLFSMSDLQSYVCKKNKGLAPADVLAATQSLYEKGLVTYPRTNSNYLAAGEADRVEAILRAWGRERFPGIDPKRGDKNIYDDSKVESHSALMPTERVPIALSSMEKEIYDTILNRFLAVFYVEEAYADKTEITLLCAGEEFTVKGSIIAQRGWLRFEDLEKKDKLLPVLAEDDSVPVYFTPVVKETSPPKRYTVETLNAWMKAPFRGEEKDDDYTDAEWKDILADATICTEATRANTIDRCIKSKYIELKKGCYHALEDGFRLVDTMKRLHIDLSPRRTADLSRSLHDVVAGKKKPAEVLDETRVLLDEIFTKGPD
ncbi:MAG: hypothetical protein K5696_05230 [Lachnospiraceae bacterium]|nr:hypothetical protein [Lachnospiraceae bacterium]